MRAARGIGAQLAGLALLVGLLVAAAFLLVKFVSIVGDADANVQAAAITAIVAVALFVGGRTLDTRTKNEERRREKMVPIYDAMIAMFMRMSEFEDGEIPEDFTKEFVALQQEMLIWAPPKVINAFVAWRESTLEDDPRVGPLLTWEKVLYAMRKDVGNASGGLGDGDLLRIILTDWDEVAGLDSGQQA